MKRIKQWATFVLLAGFMAQAQGDFVTLTEFSLWSNTYEDPEIRITTPIALPKPENCADADSYFVRTSLSPEIQQRIYSTLLAAKMGGVPVDVFIDGCHSSRPAVVTARIN